MPRGWQAIQRYLNAPRMLHWFLPRRKRTTAITATISPAVRKNHPYS